MFCLAEQPEPGLLLHYTLSHHGWKLYSDFLFLAETFMQQRFKFV